MRCLKCLKCLNIVHLIFNKNALFHAQNDLQNIVCLAPEAKTVKAPFSGNKVET